MLPCPTPTYAHACTHSSHRFRATIFRPKRAGTPKRPEAPALASPPQEATSESALHCCQPKGRGLPVQFPACSLPFLRGHHSLSYVRCNELHAHQLRAITTFTDGSAGWHSQPSRARKEQMIPGSAAITSSPPHQC